MYSMEARLHQLCFRLMFLKKNNSKKYLIDVIYRHPNNSKSDFITRFGDILQKLNRTNLKTFIVGDFNIDTLCSNFDQLSSSSKDYLLLFLVMNFLN